MPATKREDIRRPIEEDSEKLRRDGFRDKAMKVERKTGMAMAFLFSHSGLARWRATARLPVKALSTCLCYFGTGLTGPMTGPMEHSRSNRDTLEVAQPTQTVPVQS
jgi:hypothetical protein